MTWQELVDGHASTGILPKYHSRGSRRVVPNSVAKKMLRATFNSIALVVMRGERVMIPGFGIFYLRRRVARTVRNPETKELMQLSERSSVGFRASGKIMKLEKFRSSTS